MNEGTIKEIKLEDNKTFIKINFDLKFEEKKDDKTVVSKNIYIYVKDDKYIPIFIDLDQYFKFNNADIVSLSNRKCVFELDLGSDFVDKKGDIYSINTSKLNNIKIKAISIKAD